MSLNDYLNLFVDAGITERPKQEKYSRYIDAAIAQGDIKVDEIIGVGEAPHGLYVVNSQAVTHVNEFGMFKKRVGVNRVTSITAIAKLTATNTPPSDASIKFEGRHWTKFSITGRDSKGQVALEIAWGSGDESSDKRECEHLFKLIKAAMGEVRTMCVGLKPLSPRGEYLVEEMKDGLGSSFRGVSADGVWLFGPHYGKALEVYRRRLAVMEPQWILHVEAKLYD